MVAVGTIRELWRFPVKSMAGERLDVAEVGAHGVRGDRVWAVRDDRKGVIASGKQLPALMRLAARFVDPGAREASPPVAITLPDGREVTSDDPDVHRRLGEALGRPVTLCPLRPASDREHYRRVESPADERRVEIGLLDGEVEPDPSVFPLATLAELARYATPRGTYFDACALHVLTTASLAAIAARAPGVDLDVRRFRPNLLIETGGATGLIETGWIGGRLRVGALRARLVAPTPRCSMPGRAQPGVEADREVVRAVAVHAGRWLGAYAEVDRPGTLRVGDAVAVEPPSDLAPARWLRTGRAAVRRLAVRGAAILGRG